MKISLILACALSIMAAGCGTPAPVRDSTRVLALYNEQVAAQAAQYEVISTRVLRARLANLARIEQEIVKAERENAEDLQVWVITDDVKRLTLVKQIKDAASTAARQLGEAQELAVGREKERAAASAGLAVKPEKLLESAKALAALAEPTSTSDQLRSYADFFKAVKKELDAQQKQAEEAAKSAVDTLK